MPQQQLLSNHAGTASQAMLARCGVGQSIQLLAERFSCERVISDEPFDGCRKFSQLDFWIRPASVNEPSCVVDGFADPVAQHGRHLVRGSTQGIAQEASRLQAAGLLHHAFADRGRSIGATSRVVPYHRLIADGRPAMLDAQLVQPLDLVKQLPHLMRGAAQWNRPQPLLQTCLIAFRTR